MFFLDNKLSILTTCFIDATNCNIDTANSNKIVETIVSNSTSINDVRFEYLDNVHTIGQQEVAKNHNKLQGYNVPSLQIDGSGGPIARKSKVTSDDFSVNSIPSLAPFLKTSKHQLSQMSFDHEPLILVPISFINQLVQTQKVELKLNEKRSALKRTKETEKDDATTKRYKVANNTVLKREEKNEVTFELCKVCGDRAGVHNYYGGKSCPSCRAFFRRSVKKFTK